MFLSMFDDKRLTRFKHSSQCFTSSHWAKQNVADCVLRRVDKLNMRIPSRWPARADMVFVCRWLAAGRLQSMRSTQWISDRPHCISVLGNTNYSELQTLTTNLFKIRVFMLCTQPLVTEWVTNVSPLHTLRQRYKCFVYTWQKFRL